MAGGSFDYLWTLKKLLGSKDDSLDDVLLVYIDIAKDSIMNYCNIREVPPALKRTVCVLAYNVYKDVEGRNAVGGIVGNVSRIDEDGRSVSFATAADSYAIQVAANNRVKLLTELNRYKKLYRV